MKRMLLASVIFMCCSITFAMDNETISFQNKKEDQVINIPQGKTATEILNIKNTTQFKGELQYLVSKHIPGLINKKRNKNEPSPESQIETLKDIIYEVDTLESHVITEMHDLNQQAGKLWNNERLKDTAIGTIWGLAALASFGGALYLVLSKNKKPEDKVAGATPLATATLGFGYQSVKSFVTAVNNDSINNKINDNLLKSKTVSKTKMSIQKNIEILQQLIEKKKGIDNEKN